MCLYHFVRATVISTVCDTDIYFGGSSIYCTICGSDVYITIYGNDVYFAVVSAVLFMLCCSN